METKNRFGLALVGFALVFLMCIAVATAQNRVVVIPLIENYKINSANCPPATGDALAGPTEMYNFCWYLSEDGINCDKTCADLGGANLAYGAEGEWADTCSVAPNETDVTTWFYNNGNPGNWNVAGDTTGFHTLGYGYDGGFFYGKCASGAATGTGAYPSDPNGFATRNNVCPCFGLMKP